MSRKMKGIILAMLAGSLWASTGLFLHFFNNIGITSMELVTMRTLLGSLMIGVYMLFKDKSLFRIRLKDSWIFLGAGVFSILIFSLCYYYTIQKASMAQAAVLMYLSATVVLFLSALFFKEKITGIKVLGVVLAFTGCVFVTGVLSSGTAMAPMAIVTGLLSALLYGMYSIFSRWSMDRGYHSLTITFYTFVVAMVGCLFITNLPKTLMKIAVSWQSICMMPIYVLVTTVMAYLLYTFSLSYVENSIAGIVASVEPVVAALFGLFLGQKLSGGSILGMALVLTAVVLIGMPAKKG